MMTKPKVYLDTTVPSAYYDDRTPDRQRLTRQFWTESLPNFEVVISTIVLMEILDTQDAERRDNIKGLVDTFEVLDFDEEAYELAQEYVKRGIFPEKYTSDANHVAIAVVNGIGYFASWNFKHVVKVNTRRKVNLVNALLEFQPIEIIAPPEL
ncbi:MAG: type II toxin-antitoxin system VapC family toxin [Candidatus Desulfatibia sp.]|uniref:type II toxin-antitoxin system VapC family toxin n=1 Tax=Candidatus Desulfatibia sp. TaxID=3101189 RepID=UPI002F339E13